MTAHTPHTLKRIAPTAVNRALRGKVVSIVGMQGATWFDSPRVIVRIVRDDGTLGDEYRVLPSIIVSL